MLLLGSEKRRRRMTRNVKIPGIVDRMELDVDVVQVDESELEVGESERWLRGDGRVLLPVRVWAW
jgi:hypothetical protein